MAHEPVLLTEMLEALSPADDCVYVDGTFGGGGYARAILGAARCRLIGIDRDPEAVARGRGLAAHEPQLTMLEGRFGDMRRLLACAGVEAVDGIVLDVGVSSFQLDEPGRGFSFRQDGPLDMRMSSAGGSAADLVNDLDERELAALFRQLGEEPEAGRVARAIVRRRAERPFARTADLAAVIAAAKHRGKPGRDPATLVFQALRMAVNDELGELEAALASSIGLLRPGGRLAVVAFHSAEDRLVKRFVDSESGRGQFRSRHMPEPPAIEPRLTWVTRKAVQPTPAEVQRNPRARSARLRVALRTAAAAASEDEADDRHAAAERRLAA